MSASSCPHCGESHPTGTFACPRTQRRLAGLLAPGTIIDGKYKITGVIGSGGMGVVYRAENVKISRAIALKMLLPEYVVHPELNERVEREARIAGGIDHPNVVTIVDLGSTPTYGPYIAMELLRGEELATRIENNHGKLPGLEAADIARQVLSALDAAHTRGVVHRDLKPENVFLTPGEGGRTVVKVLDFGISKVAADKPGVSSLTRTGTVVGTPQFMAPEQAAGARNQDARVDVYAAGALLYAMLCGALPYEAENYNLLINAILNNPPIELRSRDRTIDPELAAIAMKALSREPEDRYPSARAMQDALAAWVASRTAPRPAPPPGLGATVTAPFGARVVRPRTPPHEKTEKHVLAPPEAIADGGDLFDEPTESFATPTFDHDSASDFEPTTTVPLVGDSRRAEPTPTKPDASQSARVVVAKDAGLPGIDGVAPTMPAPPLAMTHASAVIAPRAPAVPAFAGQLGEGAIAVDLNRSATASGEASATSTAGSTAGAGPAASPASQSVLGPGVRPASAAGVAPNESSASIKLPTPLEWENTLLADGASLGMQEPSRSGRRVAVIAGAAVLAIAAVFVISPGARQSVLGALGLGGSGSTQGTLHGADGTPGNRVGDAGSRTATTAPTDSWPAVRSTANEPARATATSATNPRASSGGSSRTTTRAIRSTRSVRGTSSTAASTSRSTRTTRTMRTPPPNTSRPRRR